ncbi:hypothetical protein GH714_002404 [Hevea brasiliensis]|uniref:RING-type domain-containing protein n=2 Tax=Hevea brasiliensis TaxID=3981 RepID=A0A6A6LC91_HEVBR|nr:hypothetical protein GH714_002404 [Hevea brasiliensis]
MGYETNGVISTDRKRTLTTPIYIIQNQENSSYNTQWFQSAFKMSARRIEVNLNSSISKFLNPTQPPNLFLELRFHFNYRKLLRNLAGELIEMEAYPTAPTSSFPFQIQPLRLLDLPLCRRHLDELFSCFVFDYQLREFLTYRIANFLIFLANRHPFLGFPVVADVNIIHEDLLDANPIDLTMIMDEVSQEVIPRSASSSVLNQLRKWRFFAAKEGGDCAICLEELSGARFPLTKMPCSHIFHERCISRWLKVRNSCPSCRRELED